MQAFSITPSPSLGGIKFIDHEAVGRTVIYSGAYSNSVLVHDPQGQRPPRLLS